VIYGPLANNLTCACFKQDPNFIIQTANWKHPGHT